MAITVASASLTDESFLKQFLNCKLPLTSFRHGDHLRLAWICLESNSLHRAGDVVRSGIQQFAKHHHVAHIFHETLTMAWVRLLATHTEVSFAEF